MVSGDDAKELHSHIPGAFLDVSGVFAVPGTSEAALWLNFGGVAFDIDARDIVYMPVDLNKPQRYCFSGIVASEANSTQWVVGALFGSKFISKNKNK